MTVAASELIEAIAKRAETPFYEDGIDDAEEWAAFRELLREGITIALDDLGVTLDGSRWTCATHAELTGDPFYCSKHGALEDCVASSCAYVVMVERPAMWTASNGVTISIDVEG